MAQLISAPPSQPTSPETYPTVLSSTSVEHSYTLPPSVSVFKIYHSYTQTASPKTSDLSQSTPAPTSEDPIVPKEGVNGGVPPTHVRCPHCPIVLYKRNLFLHIQRKHGQVKDTTSQSHLTSVDQSNGLYAVRKNSRGLSVSVHVQCKTWGQQHVTRCESSPPSSPHLPLRPPQIQPLLHPPLNLCWTANHPHTTPQYHGCLNLQLLGTQTMELSPPAHKTVRLHHNILIKTQNPPVQTGILILTGHCALNFYFLSFSFYVNVCF